jgi:hypothetical protein
MNINRHNYEEFFLLYVDNELSAAERTEVEAFVQQNPDLRKELAVLQEFKLTPEDNIVFAGKDALLKTESIEDGINSSNYETFFVLYNDDELNNTQKAMVEGFFYSHPRYQSEFELLQQVRMEPEMSIAFPNKELLYRKEDDDRKVVPFPWWRLAVAAILLLIAGLWWLNYNKPAGNNLAGTDSKKIPQNNQPAVIKPNDKKTNNQPGIIKPKEDLANKESKDKENNNPVKPQVKEPGNNYKENKSELAINKTKNRINNNPIPKENDLIAEADTRDRFTSSSVKKQIAANNNIAINAVNPAIDKQSIIDQPANILNPDASNNENITYASLNSDNFEVLNTSVSRKNNFKGFLRKASRFIAKKSSLSNDDGNRKGILIGGFEIAVK